MRKDPGAIAITPNGNTAYVVNRGSDTVTPIQTATNKAGKAITVGKNPGAIAITPNGKTAYVVNGNFSGPGTVTPISTATNKAGKPITVGKNPGRDRDHPERQDRLRRQRRLGHGDPDQHRHQHAGKPIKVGSQPDFIAITPNGKTAYVINGGSGNTGPATVTPISTATNTAGKPITVGGRDVAFPDFIAITPNGKTAYVSVPGDVYAAPGLVVPIQTATNTAGQAIMVGKFPGAIAITPNGKTAYVANNSGVTPIDTATNKAGKPIKGVGRSPSRSRRTGRPPTSSATVRTR